MTFDLTIEDFPSDPRAKQFEWAPVLFHPVRHAPDRLTIGVVVREGNQAHLLAANRLNKLECLFEDRSIDAIFAASVALEAIATRLKAHGTVALDGFALPVSGIELGEFRHAEARDWESLASRWLEASSALFERPRYSDDALVMADALAQAPLTVAKTPAGAGRERLPLLVLEYIQEKRPTYARYFTPRVLKPRSRRPSYEAAIDYAGQKIVANFGTLRASHAQSVNLIKRRMWDLTVDKEREAHSMVRRNHEMIVQAPAKNDPQISDTQYKNVVEALRVLEAEADTNEIRLRPMTSVEQIGDHLLAAEAA